MYEITGMQMCDDKSHQVINSILQNMNRKQKILIQIITMYIIEKTTSLSHIMIRYIKLISFFKKNQETANGSMAGL